MKGTLVVSLVARLTTCAMNSVSKSDYKQSTSQYNNTVIIMFVLTKVEVLMQKQRRTIHVTHEDSDNAHCHHPRDILLEIVYTF